MTVMLGSIPCGLGVNNSPASSSSSCSWEEIAEQEVKDEYSPISTPFLNHDITGSNPNAAAKPPFITFLLASIRNSLLTCSVDTQQLQQQQLQASSSSSSSSSLDIGRPTDVEHVSHVTFDRFNGFLGLPLEFQPDLPPKVPSASTSVFGVSPLSMQCSIDERGNSVPTILIMMQKCLYQQGGLQAEGIFRITAENGQEQLLRSQLNKGVIPQGIDVHCLAGLIKAWFRELPKGVLDSVSAEQVMHCNTEDECTQLVKLLPPTEASLLDWAVNLMADVVHHEHHNKMNARNIAMVFAPNMTQMADPLTALIHAVQVMNFLKTLIVRTLRLRQESASEARLVSSYADSLNPSTNIHPPMSIGDLIFDEKHLTCGNPTHPTKLYRSITLDRLEFNPKQKHRKNDEEGKEYVCFSGDSSPVTSLASECSKQESRERILDRLNFRKGVKKLCSHPVFQLNKPANKKIAELDIVNK